MTHDHALTGLRVTIMGLGRSPDGSGNASARFFARRGADVIVTDRAPASTLRDAIRRIRTENVTLVIGKHRERDFIGRDLIIQNPAVPSDSRFLDIARRNGIPIETDMSLFAMLTNRPMIGITGTRGKSTTAAWTYDMLKRHRPQPILAGNIRVSPLAISTGIAGTGPAVLELSSWMLESLHRHQFAPSIAVITNVYPDHLDRYPSFDAYARSKRTLIHAQKPQDIVVLNRDNQITRSFALHTNAHVVWFSQRRLLTGDGVYVDRGYLRYRLGSREVRIVRVGDLSLPGNHNVENAMAAAATALAWGVPLSHVRTSLQSFRGLPYRCEIVSVKQGVQYVNDASSTMPEATIAAVRCLDRPTVLIAGGNDKVLSFESLGKALRGSLVRHVLLLPGTATKKIERAIRRSTRISMTHTPTLTEAVSAAEHIAVRGWTVLFSPGATSFASFANEFERGDAFNVIVRRRSRGA